MSFMDSDLFQADEVIKEELIPNENVIWTGKPESGQLFKTSDIFMIPFSIMWGGFALFWESTAITMNAPLLFKIWGIPFVVVGLYMIFGRFIYEFYNRKALFYGITNKRIIIKQTIIPKKTTTLILSNIQEVNLRIKKNGNGDIIFAPERSLISSFNRQYQPPSFLNIKDCKEIYAKILEIKQK